MSLAVTANQPSARAILLGAGAAMDAGLPSTVEMTEALVDGLAFQPYDFRAVASFVLASLRLRRARLRLEPINAVDAEELIDAVELLASRHELPLAPFVSSWDPSVEAFDFANRTDPFALRKLRDVLQRWIVSEAEGLVTRKVYGRSSGASDFDKAFPAAVKSVTGEVGVRGMFEHTAAELVRNLISLVRVEDVALLDYLKPLALLAQDQGRLLIGSLNYDTSVETVCEMASMKVWTGIDEIERDVTLQPPQEGVVLVKMHGSIDWVAATKTHPYFQIPSTAVRQVNDDELKNGGYRPAVLFGGQGNKLTADGPYLELLRIFTDGLAQVGRLTVVGYSFRDRHINSVMTRWLLKDADRQLDILDPGLPERDPFVRYLTEGGVRNRVRVIASKAIDAFSELLK